MRRRDALRTSAQAFPGAVPARPAVVALRAAVYAAAATLLAGCVPIGVRIQNMFSALLG